MSGHHFFEFQIGSKNEDIKKNRGSLEDPPVFNMDKNVMTCELPEILVSNYKEVTYHVVKDICGDEDVPMMQERILFSKFKECVQDSSKLDQEKVIVTGLEVKDGNVGCDDNSPKRLVVLTSRNLSKEALTLGDIISMENSKKPPNNINININGPEENVDQGTKQETAKEPKADNLRDFDGNFENWKKSELENRRLIYELEDSYDERSFSEAESSLAHITYSGSISVPGSISVRSDGSENSFAFPILQSEWNSSPVRLVKSETTQLRKEKGWRHYSLLLCCRF